MHRPVPHTVFTVCVAVYLLIASAGLWAVHQTPWLGLKVTADARAGTLRIESVDAEGPAAGLLLAGQLVSAVGKPGAVPLALDARWFALDPDNWPTWTQARQARTAMQSIHTLLRSSTPVELHFASGQTSVLTPQRHTPLAAYPMWLWLGLAVALASFLCAASVFAFRPERDANRYFALSGTLVMTLAVLAGVSETARLGMSGELLARLFKLIHLGEFALIACIAALAGTYPNRLRAWKQLRAPFFLLMLLAYPLGDMRIGDGPGLMYRASLALGMIGLMLLLLLQWRAQRRRTDRSRGHGFILALSLVITADALFYLLPPMLGDGFWIGRGIGTVGLNLGYILLGVVIYRSGLFDVDRWMIGAWLAFCVGAGLLVIDAVVILLLGRTEGWVVASLFIAGLAWIYFPLRQGAWMWLTRRRPLRDLRGVSPLLFKRLLAEEARTAPDRAWRNLLLELFAPLHLTATDSESMRPTLFRGGLEMHVPAVCGCASLRLSHADRGNRLFSGDDVQLVHHLGDLADKIHRFRDALDTGARAERQRIAQDLHDDVVPPLLSLVYRAQSQALSAEARAVLHELREILRELDARAPRPRAP